MKRLLGLLVVLAAVGVAAIVGSGGSSPAGPAGPDLAPLRAAAALEPCPAGVGDVPDLTLPCLGGGPDVRLAGNPPGVPTLVNVYGSWCAPCQEEMPLLVTFSRKFAGKVALLGVATQDDVRLALRFAKDFGQRWPAVVDDQGTFMRRYSSGPPVTLFVDEGGTVVHVQRGPFRDLPQLESAVAEHLGVRL
jgi:thiol-disulfide isomerase/thioredoxin